MLNYLIKLMLLLAFSLYIVFQFYLGEVKHVENFDGYFLYLFLMFIIYGVYKYYQLTKKKIQYSLVQIVGYFLLHLFVLCLVFFNLNDISFLYSFLLFVKIIGFSLLPITILLISYSFGKQLNTNYIKGIYKNKTFNFLLSMGLGLFSFLFILVIFGILGLYNIFVLVLISTGFLLYSWGEFKNTLFTILHYKINFEKINRSYLLSTEFLFIISSLVLSVSLINIVRPFPIGWDDLGAYMNYGHIFAESKAITGVSGMKTWEVFTGIGYLFKSPTQAFFINIVGGFLSFIAILLISKDLLKSRKQTYFNIPLLLSTIFISLPMVVFQQAKDMKLDAGLFFISITGLYLLIKLYHKKIDNKKSKNRVLLIIGLLAGLAFVIKFTALLFISALIGLVFYIRLGLLGFAGYLSLFIAIFTKAGLWSKMNVVVNSNKIDGLETQTFIVFSILGLGLLGYKWFKNKKNTIKLLKEFSILLVGIIIALLPYATKNIIETYPNIGIHNILAGKNYTYTYDKNKLKTSQEIEKLQQGRKMQNDGTTVNEDFGRYFGYEKGINNYIKLPWNITMQSNETKGEFTNIGFIFLAFLPAILLFLPFRNKVLAYIISILLVFELLVFQGGFNGFFTELFSSFNLPYGYSILFLFIGLPSLYLLIGLDKTKQKLKIFKYNLVFVSFYGFLWMISAFGVPWYGIVMYFSFLLAIGVGLHYIASFTGDEKYNFKQLKKVGSGLIFGIFAIYIFYSIIPHSFINLKKAGFIQYKIGENYSEQSPYLYNPDYKKIIYNINIDNLKKQEFLMTYIEPSIIKLFPEIINLEIDDIFELLKQLKQENNTFITSVDITEKRLYKNITNPNIRFKSKSIIFRSGTFLKYYISDNYNRLIEDNLLFTFDDLIWNKQKDKTIDNFSKIGVDYILMDLNAATIDKDPKHNLTKRYEKLLDSVSSSKVTLIETDSLCLKIALEDFKKSLKTPEDSVTYMNIAGVNYESYIEGKTINRRIKLLDCYNYIISLIKDKKINNNNYSYINNINSYILKNQDIFQSNDDYYGFFINYINTGKKALFRIKK